MAGDEGKVWDITWEIAPPRTAKSQAPMPGSHDNLALPSQMTSLKICKERSPIGSILASIFGGR